MSDEVIRKQWNEAAEIWSEFVRSGKDYYREFLNGPALKLMIGDVVGKKILDIGCGEGYFTRYFSKAGAAITGIDFSEALIKEALKEEEKQPLGAKYFIADAANLHMLESESFDIALCYMALQDIRDYEKAISEASRILKIGGRFVVLIPHPSFTVPRFVNGKVVSGWESHLREDGSREYLFYRVDNYFCRLSYTIEWGGSRLSTSFVTTSFHRTLSNYVNVMNKYGLVITSLDEPQPVGEGVKIHPPLKKHYRVPQSIIIEATKTQFK